MDIRMSIKAILSDATARKNGLHVDHITRHIINGNRTLFSDESEFDFETIKRKVNALLLREIKKKKGEYKRVINPKTKKYRKGVYKLKAGR